MELKSKIWLGSLFLLVVFTGCFLFSYQVVQAIGISPPAVINHHLLRGSHFQQRIYINQGDPKEALHATANINVPDNIKDWITLLPGTEFTISTTKLFPVFVVIDVPDDAELGNYGGEIKITTRPKELKEGQVSIGIGLAITLDLAVVEEEIINFSIENQRVQPMEEGWPVKLVLTIDNKGNTKAKPYKVFLEVYNRINGSFLGSGESSKCSPDYVESFKKGEIAVEFPVSLIDLPVGLYWAQGKIYKSQDEIVEYKFPFEVLERGTLPRKNAWLKWLLIGLGGAAFLGLIAWSLRKVDKKTLAPLSFITRVRPSVKVKKKKTTLKKQAKVKKKVKKRKQKTKKTTKLLEKEEIP